MDQWWARPHPDHNCLVMHASCPLFKSKLHARALEDKLVLWLGEGNVHKISLFVLLHNVAMIKSPFSAFTITCFLNWSIESGWPSMACSEFQSPGSDLNNTGNEAANKKQGKLWKYEKRNPSSGSLVETLYQESKTSSSVNSSYQAFLFQLCFKCWAISSLGLREMLP